MWNMRLWANGSADENPGRRWVWRTHVCYLLFRQNANLHITGPSGKNHHTQNTCASNNQIRGETPRPGSVLTRIKSRLLTTPKPGHSALTNARAENTWPDPGTVLHTAWDKIHTKSHFARGEPPDPPGPLRDACRGILIMPLSFAPTLH